MMLQYKCILHVTDTISNVYQKALLFLRMVSLSLGELTVVPDTGNQRIHSVSDILNF